VREPPSCRRDDVRRAEVIMAGLMDVITQAMGADAVKQMSRRARR
jgi:hypothetical protein